MLSRQHFYAKLSIFIRAGAPSDNGTSLSYLGHLRRWSALRWIYQRRIDSQRISGCPVALVPMRQPSLSPGLCHLLNKNVKNLLFYKQRPVILSITVTGELLEDCSGYRPLSHHTHPLCRGPTFSEVSHCMALSVAQWGQVSGSGVKTRPFGLSKSETALKPLIAQPFH